MKVNVQQMTGGAIAILLLLGIAAGLVLWSGAYSFAADAPHSAAMSSVIEYARERSVDTRSEDIKVPPLAGQALVVKGAGNYQAMCAQCHRAPGGQDTELSRGLYPAPPDLTRHAAEAASAFWTIKHGIKASGMPAWGKSMDDADIWSLVAFLQQLPELDQAAYRSLVEQSGGHEHGGGADPHHHGDAAGADTEHKGQSGDAGASAH